MKRRRRGLSIANRERWVVTTRMCGFVRLSALRNGLTAMAEPPRVRRPCSGYGLMQRGDLRGRLGVVGIEFEGSVHQAQGVGLLSPPFSLSFPRRGPG
jgi:hypothetical protein